MDVMIVNINFDYLFFSYTVFFVLFGDNSMNYWYFYNDDDEDDDNDDDSRLFHCGSPSVIPFYLIGGNRIMEKSVEFLSEYRRNKTKNKWIKKPTNTTILQQQWQAENPKKKTRTSWFDLIYHSVIYLCSIYSDSFVLILSRTRNKRKHGNESSSSSSNWCLTSDWSKCNTVQFMEDGVCCCFLYIRSLIEWNREHRLFVLFPIIHIII